MIIDNYGDTIRTKTYFKQGVSMVNGYRPNSVKNSNNEVYFIGTYFDSSRYGFLSKFNDQGDLLWNRTYGDTITSTEFNQIAKCNDGNYVVVGYRANNYDVQALLTKIDSNGNVMWSRSYGDFYEQEDLVSVQQTRDGGFILGGGRRKYDQYIHGPSVRGHVNTDPMLIKVDSNGIVEWTYIYDTIWDELNAYVIQTKDGGFAFGGEVSVPGSTGGPSRNGYPALYKVDSSGNLLWVKRYGRVMNYAFFSKIMELEDSSLIGMGRIYRPGGGGPDGLILKTRGNGDSLWMRDYAYNTSSTNEHEYFADIIIDNDRFIAVGQNVRIPNVKYAAWITTLDTNGCSINNCTVDLMELQKPLEGRIQCYPNPSEGILKLSSQNTIKQLQLFDKQGRLIMELFPQKSELQLELPQQSGLYFLKWKAEDHSFGTQKIIRL